MVVNGINNHGIQSKSHSKSSGHFLVEYQTILNYSLDSDHISRVQS